MGSFPDKYVFGGDFISVFSVEGDCNLGLINDVPAPPAIPN